MLVAAFIATALLYALSSGLKLFFLWKGGEGVLRWGRGAAGLAIVGHLTFLGLAAREGVVQVDIRQVLSFASLLLVAAHLITALKRPQLKVLGAFIVPIALVFFLAAAIHGSVHSVPEPVRSALLPIHIGVNVLGIVAFALACAVAAAYLLQERQLKQKKFGALFQRLPSLDVLDSLAFRLVLAGFPLFTVGVVTGTIWALRLEPEAPAFTLGQIVGFVAWVAFAAVLLLRVAGGFRGRKAAIGTVVGFACTAVALLGYLLRSTEGAG